MIALTGYTQIAGSDADFVFDSSTAVVPFKVGTRAVDADGNEYVFARGNAGIKKGSAVLLTPNPLGGSFNVMNSATINGQAGAIANENILIPVNGVSLLAAGDVGPVGIAMGYGEQVADATTKYGWFKIKGIGTAQFLAAADGAAAYASATAGSITNAVVAANKVAGLVFKSAGAYNNGSATATDGQTVPSNLALVSLTYPYIG